MRYRLTSVGVVLVGVVVSGALGLSWGVDAQASHKAMIAFASDRDGDSDIYVMDADGANVRNVTNDGFDNHQPCWSPDGRQIAFRSTRAGASDIYVIDVDGGDLRNLTDNVSYDSHPSWSPDGERIAFERNGRRSGIWLMDPHGEPLKRLSRGGFPVNNIYDGSPSWSPDGWHIAYTCRDGGVFDIQVMDADGRNVRKLTDNLWPDKSPSWSPDGRQIAYMSEEADGNWNIYVMDAAGGDRTNLSGERHDDQFPSWSQDGRQIVFQSYRHRQDRNFEIYIMDADGRNPRNLTDHPSTDTSPAYSDPALLTVSPAGRSALTWGWIKESGSQLE